MVGPETPPVRASWLVTAVAAVGLASALMVLTADLDVTAGRLRHGVGGMDQLVAANDVAVQGAGALGPTQTALDESNAEMAGMVDSLGAAVGALDRMTADLGRLTTSLHATGAPVAGALASVGQTAAAADGAKASVDRTSALLAQADQTARSLRPLLDEAATRAAAVERKLRVFRLLPAG